MNTAPIIEVMIVEGALSPYADTERADGATGAVLCFEGVVRAMEDGRPLVALDYEVYEPMALRELTQLANDIAVRHGLHRVAAWHSRGRVNVGEISFRLVIWSAHRREALDAMDEFIDRLKQDVPIWKHAVFAK
jgi:molybdopterin synthase catalytic subunit